MRSAMMYAHNFACLRIGDNGKYLVPQLCSIPQSSAAVNADGNLAAATERGKRCPLYSNGKARGRMVEECYSGNSDIVVLAGLDAQRTLPSRGTKILRLEPLTDPLGFFHAVKAGRGQQNRIHLALGQLAQARVHIAAKFLRLDVGSHGLQLRASALAAGAHARALGQCRQILKIYRYEYVPRINPLRRGG